MKQCALMPVLVALVGALAIASSPAAQSQPARGIVNVAGQLYRAQNDNHFNVFLVTPEGINMTDPINRDFSRWLKAEFASRFKASVRHVLYSHHRDHASGGVVFADTAEFIGHALSGTRRDVEVLRQYLEDIAAAVAVEVAAGRSLVETQRRIILEACADWDRYDTILPAHIAQGVCAVEEDALAS